MTGNFYLADSQVTARRSAISSAFLGSIPGNHITFVSAPASKYPTAESVDQAIGVDFDQWAVIEIAANATARLEAARSSGDASWEATSVITVRMTQMTRMIWLLLNLRLREE